MSAPRELPARPSLDSLRKQAKRLARAAAAGDSEALARVHAHLPRAHASLSARDAQFVIAREYGFAGWAALSDEVKRRVGDGLNAAVARARTAIHDRDNDTLRTLLAEYPALVTWRDDNEQTLLDATTSYAMDCLDPEREHTYNRPDAAATLIDAGAVVARRTWGHVIRTGASGMLRLFADKRAIPRTLAVLAALGDEAGVRAGLGNANDHAPDKASDDEATEVDHAFMVACRFRRTAVAQLLLERAITVDTDLRARIERWHSRHAFIDFLSQQSGILWRRPETTPWRTFVVLQLAHARDTNDLAAFNRWLDDEPWVLAAAFVEVQSTLLLPACYQKDREAFIRAVFDRGAALLHVDTPPQSSHIVQALSYGNAHLVPLLTRVWPLPDDLPHAAGVGDAHAVIRWFDAIGAPALGPLTHHYPASDAQFPRADLHWGPPTVQQTLDVALAWAVLNHHFAIAEFLLARGADINTDWATHEPASILHEAAVQGNVPAVRFLIDHGADLMKLDYRYRGTPEGWARYGSGDEQMADLLAAAREQRERT